jgi:signal transduction histidine kinase
VRIVRQPWLQLVVLLVVISAITATILTFHLRWRLSGLPYKDSFAAGSADEWEALGGTWELSDGTMRNDSDERGAKLVTGSLDWHDYSLEADIQLLGQDGDAGLIARSRDEEEGVDSYSGYYAGLRNHDNTLVIGRADHGWLEGQAVPMEGGVLPFRWYHLKLVVAGCDMAVSAADRSSSRTITATMSEVHCQQAGRIGLRSYSSGGIWRNVRATRSTRADLEFLQSRAPRPETFHPDQQLEPDIGTTGNPIKAEGSPRVFLPSTSIAQPISSLRLVSRPNPGIVTIRGIVVLTSPVLYVQDSTGGTAVLEPLARSLKVGDEVEIIGQPESRDFSSVLHHAQVRLLWARTPIPPLSVTASQAATGAFDATFVELEGYLTGRESGPGNAMTLELQKSGQSFRAITSRGRSEALFRRLKTSSLLRLRGVCVVDSEYTRNLTPFVLLLPSADDVDVLAGPPWWSVGHLVALAGIALILVLAAQLIYSQVQHWRLRAVLEERGRLAHEMHDTIAQSFAGIGFQLQAIRNNLREQDESAHRQLDLASDLVRHSHDEARRSIATLRPEALESIGILPALDRCATRMVDGGSVQVVISSAGNSRPIPARISDALFKIGQEAIANAVRHAGPTSLIIRLRYEDRKVHLVIEDNGVGFNNDGDLLGFGLRGMRKRADNISAKLEIASVPNGGTTVTVVAPLPPRFALTSLPEYIRRYFQERHDAQKREDTRPYSYRR